MNKPQTEKNQKTELNLSELENRLAEQRATLKKNITDLAELSTSKERSIEIMEATLRLIPEIRRLKASAQLAAAVEKYSKAMQKVQIPDALIEFVISKKLHEIAESDFKIPPEDISTVEKKLGIIQWGSIEKDAVYSSFRGLLTQERSLLEIEAILRKVRLKISEPSDMKAELLKEEVARYFALEGGYADCGSVVHLLMNSGLADAMKQELVTKNDLINELKKLKGDMTGLSDNITKKINTSFARLDRRIPGEAPVWVRFFSHYIVTPFSGTLGGAGFAMMLFYFLVRYLYGPINRMIPAVGEMFDAFNITILCNSLKPQTVILTGFIFILFAGLIKLIEEKLIKRYTNKSAV